MEIAEITNRIDSLLQDAEVDIEGEDCSFSVSIISDEFKGLMPVKRQQKILALFAEELQTGELHALTVNAFTMEEFNRRQSHLVQITL